MRAAICRRNTSKFSIRNTKTALASALFPVGKWQSLSSLEGSISAFQLMSYGLRASNNHPAGNRAEFPLISLHERIWTSMTSSEYIHFSPVGSIPRGAFACTS